MSSAIKSGLTWAFTALQVTSDNVQRGVDLIVPSSPKSPLECRKPPLGVIDVMPSKKEGSAALSSNESDQENVKPRFSREEVADHCHGESCWMIINNKVYDVTRFLRMHPGGDDILMEYGGHDATSAFIDKGHSLDAFEMLGDYLIGTVIDEDWFPEKNYT